MAIKYQTLVRDLDTLIMGKTRSFIDVLKERGQGHGRRLKSHADVRRMHRQDS